MKLHGVRQFPVRTVPKMPECATEYELYEFDLSDKEICLEIQVHILVASFKKLVVLIPFANHHLKRSSYTPLDFSNHFIQD